MDVITISCYQYGARLDVMSSNLSPGRTCGLEGVHNAAHDDQVAQLAQALVPGKPLRQACEILHVVQPRHGEQDGLPLVLHMSQGSQGSEMHAGIYICQRQRDTQDTVTS